MTAIALPRPRNALLDRLRTIQLGIAARGAVGVGLARQRGGAAAAAAPTNYFLQSYIGTRNNYDGTAGFMFTVGGTSDIIAVALGRSVSGAITTNHRVGLWTNLGVLLETVTVNASSPIDGLGYAYEMLPAPRTLSAASTFVIGSEEFSGGDQWRDFGSISNHQATATILRSQYGGPGFAYPGAQYGGTDEGFVPPTWFT